jgi:hypothetical protein
MKYLSLCLYTLILAFSILSSELQAERRFEAVYGTDDRVFLEDYKNNQIKWYSLSVAAIVHQSKIETGEFPLLSMILGETLENENYLCSDELYAKEFTTAKCSAFLVGKDLILTAGHCITGPESCKENKFIFEFRKDLIFSRSEDEVFVPKESIYGCKEIIHREYNYDTQNDFSLVRLDREVIGREPLKFRTSKKIDINARVVALGHPSGLPMMVHEGRVLKNKNPFFFTTNMDTFAGNSGGPVINLETGLVEGIMVRGEDDYTIDDNLDCYRRKKCPENAKGCLGEEVTRITVIAELVPGMTPQNIPFVDPDEVQSNDITIEDSNDDDDGDDLDWDDYWDQPDF